MSLPWGAFVADGHSQAAVERAITGVTVAAAGAVTRTAGR
jgi:hypothetical protein